MKSSNLRSKFVAFFKAKGHKLYDPSPLVSDDPTVLFTTAGMQQFKAFYLKPDQAPDQKIVTVQPSLRTSDIDQVGDRTHLTFFEMLGNFSFGGYGKKEAIDWGLEFLTEELLIDRSRIGVSVFGGDHSLPADDESIAILKTVGFQERSLIKAGREDNFWGPTGDSGPCGPTVEFYVDGIEVWNLVFNQFDCQADGSLKNLPSLGVDTGLGLERTLKVLNRKETIFETDLFRPIIELIRLESDQSSERSERIIADHLRASAFLIAEDLEPSNKERGYVLRRLIRRMATHRELMVGRFSWRRILEALDQTELGQRYGLLGDVFGRVNQVIGEESSRFELTFGRAKREFQKRILDGKISGRAAFDLFQSFGLPIEVTLDLAKDRSVEVDQAGFERAMKAHRAKSKSSEKALFKGGLAEITERTTRLHTAHHLLLAALRAILGDHVLQRGSNITNERFRLDFSHPKPLTKEELRAAERFVNDKIKANLEVRSSEMTFSEAKKAGALAEFGDRYPERVVVYAVVGQDREPVSIEVCGGPHVGRTGEIGKFEIKKEESSSSGVRRIRATVS